VIDVLDPVARALADFAPVVALETTIITHGLPYPTNVETARRLEQAIRDEGAVPAPIGVMRGRVRVGLSPEDLESLARGPADKIQARSASTFRRIPPAVVFPGAVAISRRSWKSWVSSVMSSKTATRPRQCRRSIESSKHRSVLQLPGRGSHERDTGVAVGAGAGIAAAYMVTRFMRAMLFGVSPVDGVSFAAAPVLLLGVALVACLLPAIRASRIDPMMTLRTE